MRCIKNPSQPLFCFAESVSSAASSQQPSILPLFRLQTPIAVTAPSLFICVYVTCEAGQVFRPCHRLANSDLQMVVRKAASTPRVTIRRLDERAYSRHATSASTPCQRLRRRLPSTTAAGRSGKTNIFQAREDHHCCLCQLSEEENEMRWETTRVLAVPGQRRPLSL